MEEIYADTIIGINFNNGVVKLVLANQDLETIIKSDGSHNDEQINMKGNRIVNMPLSGFLYSVSVIENLLKDPKMVKVIESYQKAGILPKDNIQKNS